MCIVFFIIGLLFLLGAFVNWRKVDFKDGYIKKGEEYANYAKILVFLAIIVLGITILASCVYIGRAVDGRYVDGKVAMYQEENEKIEQDVSEIAKQYMKHENQTFDMSRINSSTTLVQMYPELQSSEIVQKQIDIYYENNKKIKSLKNKEYKAKKAKFMLYFGGGK